MNNNNESFFLGLNRGQTEVYLDTMAGLDFGQAIENQEKAGQMRSCREQRLPVNGTSGDDRKSWEQLGFVFSDDEDRLFVTAKFPEGWSLQPTEHSMHSNLLDDQNRKRGSMFYKAAFYDEKASIYLSRRYNINNKYNDDIYDIQVDVVDSATGSILHSFNENMKNRVGESEYQVRDELRAESKKLLERDYPDWQNSLAYW